MDSQLRPLLDGDVVVNGHGEGGPAIVAAHESEGPLTRRGPLRLKNPEFFLPLPLVSRLLNEQAPVTKVPKHGATQIHGLVGLDPRPA